MILTDSGLLIAGRIPKSADRNNKAFTGFCQLLSPATGQKIAEFPMPAIPTYEALAVADGRIFVSCEDGQLLCLEPTHGKGKLNLKKISQWHVQGSWLFNGTTAVDLLQLTTVAAADAPASARSDGQAGRRQAGRRIRSSSTISPKRRTIIGGFLAWQGHAAFKDGVSTIDAPSGAGGAYFVHKIDLGGHQQDTLALTLRPRRATPPRKSTLAWPTLPNTAAPSTFDLGKLKAGETARIVAKDTVSLAMGATGPLDWSNIWLP